MNKIEVRVMRIILLSGLDEKTPPRGYGSVETLVYAAARELTKLGHEVIVFATEDSTEAFDFCGFRPYPLLPCGVRHRGLDQEDADRLKLRVIRLALNQAVTLESDVIHNNDHTGLIAWSEHLHPPERMLTTAHWPFDNTVTGAAFRCARGHNVLTISKAQEAHARSLDYALEYRGMVYNCIAPDRFLPPKATPRSGHLAWIGRFDPLKGPEEAIAIAKTLDLPIVMAGKVDNYAKEYFDTVMKPLIAAHGGLVDFRGEVPQLEASRIMAEAKAFLMTTKYHESFGLVVPESWAAGTPVVATTMGAMPELIRNGTNGFLVPMRGGAIDIPRFAAAVRACGNISPETCRARAERFRPARMAEGYEAAYTTLIEKKQRRVRRSSRSYR